MQKTSSDPKEMRAVKRFTLKIMGARVKHQSAKLGPLFIEEPPSMTPGALMYT